MATELKSTGLTEEQKSDIYGKFQRFLTLDDLYCEKAKELIPKIFTIGNGFFSRNPNALGNVFIMGSLSEGCTLPRLFGASDLFPDKINREAEFDVDFLLVDIPEKYRSSVREISFKTAVTKIHAINFDVFKLADEKGWLDNDHDWRKFMTRFEKIINDEGYLQPFLIKAHGGERLEFLKSDKLAKLLIAAALNEKTKDITIANQPNKVKKSAITADFVLNIKEKPIFKVSIDYAIVLKIKWWPKIYSEFLSRQDRIWPSQEIINELTKECHLIAKPSEEETENEDTLEFRYSLAHIEKELVFMRSRQQKLVYEVFKILYIKFIKPEAACNEEKLTTFLCKNTMLWICERFPPDSFIWAANYDGIHQAVSILLSELLNCIQSGVMPYFFDKNENIIKAMLVQTRENVSYRIQEMLIDFERFLGIPTEKETAACHEILNLITEVSDIIDEIKRCDYTRLTKQPELILEVLAFFMDKHSKV